MPYLFSLKWLLSQSPTLNQILQVVVEVLPVGYDDVLKLKLLTVAILGSDVTVKSDECPILLIFYFGHGIIFILNRCLDLHDEAAGQVSSRVDVAPAHIGILDLTIVLDGGLILDRPVAHLRI